MKNRNKYFGLLVVISLCFIYQSCQQGNSKKGSNEIELKVSFSNTLGLKWVYLKELNVRNLSVIDSFDISQSATHTFQFNPDGPGLYLVQVKQYDFITLLLEPGEKVELSADAEKLKKEYKVSGSPGSQIILDFITHTGKNLKRIDSLKLVFSKVKAGENFPQKKAELDTAYYKIFKDQRNYIINTARSNNKSIVSVYLINQRFGPELVVQEKNDFSLFAELDSCLMTIYPTNKHVLDHHQRVSEFKREKTELKLAEERLKPGNPAPEVRLTDQKGKLFNSSDLKGKTILLYFWTATTGKARQDHAMMQSFYRANKSKGLEIVSVSLDENQELWQAALKIDRLPWITLSDPKGVKSVTARLFALHEGLPYYYVIDKEGNMAGQGMNFTEVKSLVLKTL